MARQKGVIRLQGQMGGVSFYKSRQDGYLAREKGGVDAERIKNDPKFARTRENGAEFGRAGVAGKLLRTALRTLIMNTHDSRMTSRLTKEMVTALQADGVNPRGQRTVTDGDSGQLEGFEFNINAKLTSTVFVAFNASIDRPSGVGTIVIPPFIPNQAINVPQGATHFRWFSGVAEVDFNAGTYVVDSKKSSEIVIDGTGLPSISQSNQFTAQSTNPVFLVFGVEFHQYLNGQYYPLKNGVYNSLSIVKVDRG